MAKGSRGGKLSAKELKGDVPFEEIVKASPNSLSFGKGVTILPDGYMPENAKKSDLGKLLDKYGINDVVMHTYRDKAGANDLKRMQELGFTIQAQTKGKQQAGSVIPPRDYYYMKRTGKAVTPTIAPKPKTNRTSKQTTKKETKETISRNDRRAARALRLQGRAQRKSRPKGAQ